MLPVTTESPREAWEVAFLVGDIFFTVLFTGDVLLRIVMLKLRLLGTSWHLDMKGYIRSSEGKRSSNVCFDQHLAFAPTSRSGLSTSLRRNLMPRKDPKIILKTQVRMLKNPSTIM